MLPVYDARCVEGVDKLFVPAAVVERANRVVGCWLLVAGLRLGGVWAA